MVDVAIVPIVSKMSFRQTQWQATTLLRTAQFCSCRNEIVSASLRSDNLRPVLIFFQNMLELPALGPRSKMPLSQRYSDRKPSKSLKCFPWSLADGGIPVHARKLGSGGGDPLRNHRGAFPDW